MLFFDSTRWLSTCTLTQMVWWLAERSPRLSAAFFVSCDSFNKSFINTFISPAYLGLPSTPTTIPVFRLSTKARSRVIDKSVCISCHGRALVRTQRNTRNNFFLRTVWFCFAIVWGFGKRSWKYIKYNILYRFVEDDFTRA